MITPGEKKYKKITEVHFPVGIHRFPTIRHKRKRQSLNENILKETKLFGLYHIETFVLLWVLNLLNGTWHACISTGPS